MYCTVLYECALCLLVQLRYWKSVEGRHKQKEVDFVLSPGQRHGPDMRVSVLDLPAYTALRAQVAVMNTHYTGPPSQTIDFFRPEGSECCLVLATPCRVVSGFTLCVGKSDVW